MVLRDHSTSLLSCLQNTYWREPLFASLVLESLLDYQNYLDSQNKKMKLSHHLCVPVQKLSEFLSIEIIKQNQFVVKV